MTPYVGDWLSARARPRSAPAARFLIGSADAVLGAEGIETGERLAGDPLLTARVAVQVRLPVADLERAAEHTVTLAWHEHTGARARDLTRPSPECRHRAVRLGIAQRERADQPAIG